MLPLESILITVSNFSSKIIELGLFNYNCTSCISSFYTVNSYIGLTIKFILK